MRVSLQSSLACGLLLGCSLLLSGCGDGGQAASDGQAGGGGEVVVSLLTGVQGTAGVEAVAGVVASMRYRLERIGFGEVEINALPRDEMLVRFASSPESKSARALMDTVFSKGGILELRRAHPDSKFLVASVKRLAQAGSGWWVAQDESGGKHVVGEKKLLGNESVVSVEVLDSSTGSGFDVIVTLNTSAMRVVDELRSEIDRQPLALLVDGRVMAAPLPARALGRNTILVAKGVSQAKARELGFILEAPLVVPLQTRG
jgi:hypothetical protein